MLSKEYSMLSPHRHIHPSSLSSPTAYNLVHLSDDPEELRCLECLGDARIAFYVAKLQTELHPERPTKDLASIHRDLLTNATFQGVAYKIGLDDEPAEEYSKGPGDAFEVFVEILGKERPRAATHWVADIMSPVITAVMEEDTQFISLPLSRPAYV
ncbi:hypothetical protein DFH06DRAFT_1177106 [Mycena polygramma]|nr:hypothetical protein DFH06DRAFT_1177106 [Mycena polygramma]